MCNAEVLNSTKTKRKDEKFEEYVYVMISTQNQMVNYIPLKHFQFNKIYNVTVREENIKYFDNERWDKNLQEVLKEESVDVDIVNDRNIIPFSQQEVSDISTIKNRLEKFINDNSDKKIFWNMTGGQRPFILAISQLLEENSRKNDVVCYLEGNHNQMVLLKNGKKLEGIVEDYSLDDLTIEVALKLMGFEVKITKTSHRNLVEDKNIDKNEMEFYLRFLGKFLKLEKKELRKNLIMLNKKKDEERNKIDQDQIKISIKKMEEVKDLNQDKLDKELNQHNAFGYILEKLVGYKILDVAKEKIADITFGEKINFWDKKYKVDEHHIDEFDILLLTKNGKFMVFECKTGGMRGDVAKSTKYSTYAISGVYGLPILITPLLKDELSNIDNLDDSYSNIKSAVKAAKRASLDVWGLDEIKEKLGKYIEL